MTLRFIITSNWKKSKRENIKSSFILKIVLTVKKGLTLKLTGEHPLVLTSTSYNVASKLSEASSASSSSSWYFSMDSLRIKLAFFISSSLGVL